jgi:long-subunit fatty acid transport protein
MSSSLNNVSDAANVDWNTSSPTFVEKYKMESPFRAIGSLAHQFGKKRLISFDYEYVDYSKNKMKNGNDNYNFDAENQEINTIYKAVGNIHIGGEFKATNALSLRAGYELFGNPNKSIVPDPNNHTILIVQRNTNFGYNTINAGFGYRIDNVFFDLSYTLGNRTNYMYIYQVYQNDQGYANANKIDISEPVKYHSLMHGLTFTIGVKL